MTVKVQEIRQVAAIVPELEPTVALLGAVLGIEPSVRQELTEFGLINAVLPVGDQFLELLQPVREDCSGWRYLQKRGPGFYMLIFESEEGLRPVAAAKEAGVRVVWQADRPAFTSVHFHPSDLASTLVSVDTSKVENEWPAAGTDWRAHVRSEVVTGIHVFRIAGTDPETMAAPFQRLFGMRAAQRQPRGDTAVARARVGHSGTYVDFVAPTSEKAHLAGWLREHGPGPSGIEVQVHDLESALARAGDAGVGHRPRARDEAGHWQAANLHADDLLGLPITLVEAHGDTNPWDHGA